MSSSSPFGPFSADAAVSVTCRECSHAWLYCGQTPYAQCGRCGTSNNLNGEEVDFEVL